MQMNIPEDRVSIRFSYSGPVYDGNVSMRLDAAKNINGSWYYEERWPGDAPNACCLSHNEFVEKLDAMRIDHRFSKVQ